MADVLRRLRAQGGLWLRNLELLREARQSPGDFPSIEELIAEAVEQTGKGRRGRAANNLSLAAILDSPKTLELTRRSGVLRCSRHRFNPSIPTFLASSLLTAADELGLSESFRSYLDHVVTLLQFGRHARQVFDALIKDLRKDRLTVLRGCLTTIDALFLKDLFPDVEWNMRLDAKGEKEEIAEGFSLLCALFEEHVGITKWTASLWDYRSVASGECLEIVSRAAGLRQYCVLEVLVDSFDFACTRGSGEGFRASPPSADLEKAIRLGYIEGETHRVSADSRRLLKDQSWPSLRDVGEQVHALAEEKGLIRHKEVPRRLTFEMPIPDSFIEMIRNAGPAREELLRLDEIVRAYHLDAQSLMTFRVGRYLTLAHIQLVQRLALILGAYVSMELRKHTDDPELFFNSITPVFRDEALDDLLAVALEKPKVVAEFKEVFGWPPKLGGAGFYDVQYRPLIRATIEPGTPLPPGDEWSFPCYVFASSQLMRASMVVTQRRPWDGRSDEEILGGALAATLIAAGHPARSRVKLSVGTSDLEIDLAALIEDLLLIIECKMSLLPCSAFELRSTYDQCTKGAAQLTRLEQALAAPSALRSVCEQLGVAVESVRRVRTAVVIDNGLFGGLRLQGHPVLSYRLLSAFLEARDLTVLDRRIPLRSSGPVSAKDLERFLGCSEYDRLFRAMVPGQKAVRLGECVLIRDTYVLSVEGLAREFGIDLDSVCT